MLSCLRCTNFAILANSADYSVQWEFFLLIPIIANLLILRQVIYFACMLKAVSSLNAEISDAICERALDERNVSNRLHKIVRVALASVELDRSQW
jgi:hypothetical protein